MSTFVTSDTHFGHGNILKFTNTDGSRVRPLWEDVDEMNEEMVRRWNARVRPDDVVWHLGDVSFGKSNFHHASRLNGTKHLILGNHDHEKLSTYLSVFKTVQSCARLGNLLLTHYPVHESSLGFGIIGNVHGHTHARCLRDPRYFNASVEATNYTPVTIEDVRGWFRNVQAAEELGQ